MNFHRSLVDVYIFIYNYILLTLPHFQNNGGLWYVEFFTKNTIFFKQVGASQQAHNVQRCNDDVLTSMRRGDVASTSIRRHVLAGMCRPELHKFIILTIHTVAQL